MNKEQRVSHVAMLVGQAIDKVRGARAVSIKQQDEPNVAFTFRDGTGLYTYEMTIREKGRV